MYGLEGKVALVTGAARGLGQHLALTLGRAGADLAITARDAGRLAQTTAALTDCGRKVAALSLDVCDADSVDPADLVSVTRQAKDRMGEIQLAVHSEGHNWTYFPDMEEHEVLLFKTFDSREDGRARFTIHTSFDDPSAPEDARVRESIEVRCFVFW